jgi:hypothetical protein
VKNKDRMGRQKTRLWSLARQELAARSRQDLVEKMRERNAARARERNQAVQEEPAPRGPGATPA